MAQIGIDVAYTESTPAEQGQDTAAESGFASESLSPETPYFRDERVTVWGGDCLTIMPTLEAESFDAVITDPPYHLVETTKRFANEAAERKMTGQPGVYKRHSRGFMGQRWDGGDIAFRVETWREAYRVLKPGGHLIAFGGTRTYHKMATAVEGAGFEIRDCLMFLYGSGFPKSHNISENPTFCQCDPLPYSQDDYDQMRGVRSGFSDLPAHAAAGQQADMFAPVQREVPRRGVGEARPQGLRREDARESGAVGHARAEEPGVEGRRDVLQDARQLCGSAVRTGTAVGETDVAGGRLRDGASAGDGAPVRSVADANGSSSPLRSHTGTQRSEQPRAVADERGPSALGGWPLCERCGKSVVSEGLGTALKPAVEPILLARKPLAAKNVAQNVQRHGVGAINVDGCRITAADGYTENAVTQGVNTARTSYAPAATRRTFAPSDAGRWPANVCLDEESARLLDETVGERPTGIGTPGTTDAGSYSRQGGGGYRGQGRSIVSYGDTGGASRFFYTAKASRAERQGVSHPTVKPVSLMRWLCRLVTPPNGHILDPFAGTGTTRLAALAEGFRVTLIEREPAYLEQLAGRVAHLALPLEGVA